MSEKLAIFAVREDNTRGRVYPEQRHRYRSDFGRDRDRIIHSSALRRLEGKTQVFTPGLDDYYRTRLTHTIEVAQIGKTIAKALDLNETLTEAICLAHDLGHAPFGHSGESVLNGIMKEHGGFEHNLQALKITELLEHPYPDFAGLNLLYETRLGLAKHKTLYDCPVLTQFAEKNSSLEGQIADTADRIAYNCHDLEDGMRAGVIKPEQLCDIELYQLTSNRIGANYMPDSYIRSIRIAKSIIDFLVSDCIETTKVNIQTSGIRELNDVYPHGCTLVGISAQSNMMLYALEKFLYVNMYKHTRVIEATNRAKEWLTELFGYILEHPGVMPHYYQKFVDVQGLHRTVCDYIAGMTDRYCLALLEKVRN